MESSHTDGSGEGKMESSTNKWTLAGGTGKYNAIKAKVAAKARAMQTALPPGIAMVVTQGPSRILQGAVYTGSY
jgi:hypothetical protein